MHSRHRNGPGNMYRSNSMGVGGVASATRISPEGSTRGHRMYSSEDRNYSHDDYSRGGRPKHFPPTPPPQEVDIFVEAGRLAAEYLVSKGVLPPNAVSGKWQNDVLKNQTGNFSEFRHHQADRAQVPANGRASVHSRLGNAGVDPGSLGRRKYSDEYNLLDSRNSSRERKRTGSFKNYGTEANRDSGRSESWHEKSGSSFGKEANGDTSIGNNTEHPVHKDGNCRAPSSSSSEVTQEIVGETRTEAAQEPCSLAEEADATNSTLTNKKCPPSDVEKHIKRHDDANKVDDLADAVEEERIDNGLQQKDGKSKEVLSSPREGTSVSEDHFDIVKHFKFVNFPKRTRSSLSGKGSKGDMDPMNKDVNASKKELSKGTGAHGMDDDIGSSGGNASAQESRELKHLQLGISNVPQMEKEPSVSEKTSSGQSLRSGSLTEQSQFKEKEGNEQLLEFQSSNSLLIERGEKWAIDHDSDAREDFKKIRQWFPPLAIQPDSSSLLSSPKEDQPSIDEPGTSQSAHVTPSPEQKSLDSSLFAKAEFTEEKQLFPSSFKTCDLNLVGTSDANENRDADPMLVFPPVTQASKVGTPIGVNLPMSNNPLPTENEKHNVEDNDIEVIDLDSDSAPEHKAFSNPERRGDTVFTDLDGFPNNVHNANAIPDVQDGYGLMISELLANGGPNCSSVPADLNSLHNHMGLPNTEGILGDDDSIYMSLGEIPISLLGWEQPPQDYGKPF